MVRNLGRREIVVLMLEIFVMSMSHKSALWVS